MLGALELGIERQQLLRCARSALAKHLVAKRVGNTKGGNTALPLSGWLK